MNRFQLSALLFLSIVAGVAGAACGGGTNNGSDLDVSDDDPRCVATCPETMPEYVGVGAVCDTASRAQCLDECAARIAGVPTLCQSCLLEGAYFGPGGVVIGNDGSCDLSSCTLTSAFGTCTYATDDQAAKLACLQEVDPRREVTCTPDFQSTTKCASVCN